MRVAFIALAILAAGCVTPATDVDPAGLTELVDPIIEQHDHSDPAAHALSTPNMQLLFHDALGEEPGIARGTYGEVDIVGDTAVVAVLGDGGETPGFILLDVTDRAAPVQLSFTPSPQTRVADVKLDSEASFVFVAGQKGPRVRQDDVMEVAARGAEGVDGFSTRNGVRVYDVSDPAAPSFVSFAASDSGCHMVYYERIAGGEWVFCVGENVNIYSFDRGAGALSLASIYAPLEPEAQAAATVAGLVENPSNPARANIEVVPHDVTVQEDPLTGAVHMYASYWDLGMRIVDVSDPAKPQEVGTWMGEGAQRWAGNVHTAMALTTEDGRRLVYAIPELFTGLDVPALFVLDATDLAAPELVGEWAAPGEHPNDGIRFSMHNFQIVDGRIYLAYYHAGVWVLDISADPTAPTPLGFHLPHEAVDTYLPPDEVNVPDTWDVVVKDGHIYATDINTGLYVLHYADDTLGDAALTSFA